MNNCAGSFSRLTLSATIQLQFLVIGKVTGCGLLGSTVWKRMLEDILTVEGHVPKCSFGLCIILCFRSLQVSRGHILLPAGISRVDSGVLDAVSEGCIVMRLSCFPKRQACREAVRFHLSFASPAAALSSCTDSLRLP